MTENLSLKYRPRTFEDVVGQKDVRLILSQMVKKNNVPHALIFSGTQGTGKTSIGRILAAALNCEMENKPCAKCPSCLSVYNGTSVDVEEIDAASNGRVEDIRGDPEKNKKGLRERVAYVTSGKTRVIMLDEAHSMTKEAFNALLNIFEEPPENVVFILLTTEPNKILSTVASRCVPFVFRKISISDIVSRLTYICESEGLSADPDLLLMIAEGAEGGMRDAVMAFDKAVRAGVTTANEYAELTGLTDFGSLLLRTIVSGDISEVYRISDEQLSKTGNPAEIRDKLVAVLKDILILKADSVLMKQGKPLEDRKILAASLGSDKVMILMKIMWDISKMRASENQKSVLDIALAISVDAINKKQSSSVPEVSAPKKKLSLEEMRQIS